jgi:hypothetical protein
MLSQKKMLKKPKKQIKTEQNTLAHLFNSNKQIK